MPNRRQAIIWTNAHPINWRIYAALGRDNPPKKSECMHKHFATPAYALLYQLSPFVFLWWRHDLLGDVLWIQPLLRSHVKSDILWLNIGFIH